MFNYSQATALPFVPYADVKVEEKHPQIWQSGDRPEFPVYLSSLAAKRESKAIFALLGEAPLFYPEGNFKTLLLKAYQNISGAVDKQGLLENGFTLKIRNLYFSTRRLKSPIHHRFLSVFRILSSRMP